MYIIIEKEFTSSNFEKVVSVQQEVLSVAIHIASKINSFLSINSQRQDNYILLRLGDFKIIESLLDFCDIFEIQTRKKCLSKLSSMIAKFVLSLTSTQSIEVNLIEGFQEILTESQFKLLKPFIGLYLKHPSDPGTVLIELEKEFYRNENVNKLLEHTENLTKVSESNKKLITSALNFEKAVRELNMTLGSLEQCKAILSSSKSYGKLPILIFDLTLGALYKGSDNPFNTGFQFRLEVIRLHSKDSLACLNVVSSNHPSSHTNSYQQKTNVNTMNNNTTTTTTTTTTNENFTVLEISDTDVPANQTYDIKVFLEGGNAKK
jgi:hypothetical protein